MKATASSNRTIVKAVTLQQGNNLGFTYSPERGKKDLITVSPFDDDSIVFFVPQYATVPIFFPAGVENVDSKESYFVIDNDDIAVTLNK